MTKKIAIEVHDLKVAYEKKTVLWGIDFEIPQGVICGIVGPNGAGKSTLMNACLGLVPKLSGWVRFFGEDFSGFRKKIAYVPQRDSVDFDFPISVFEVVLMGRYGHLGWIKRPGKLDKEIALDSLKKVGMEEFQDRHIADLSGGQKQRVFIARALAQEAEIFLLDEPFAGVDIATEKMIVDLLKKLAKKGKTVLVVHHDVYSVKEYFDWLVMLNVRLIGSGEVSQVFNRENLNQTYGGRLDILEEVKHL